MAANMYKPLNKKINRVDNHKHWPASINEKIQWFPFLTIMEYTANKIQDNKVLISSLLKVFSVFEIRFSYGNKDLDTLSLNCIHL